MDKTIKDRSKLGTSFPLHGWLGVCLAGLFWSLNWTLEGPRTHWGFFPMWLGYCLTVDGLVYLRRGSSLLTRSWHKYLGLFIISAPVWWIFEIFNAHLQNWHYEGTELFNPVQFWLWATLNFTIVIPAVFGSAELAASFGWIKRLVKGPRIAPGRNTTLAFFISGWVMLALLLLWPHLFFPFVWISLYFITEPVNVWLGRRNLAEYTARRDWRPVIALWTGVLITAFFWEMWNFYAFPKWVYHIPWGDALHVFEMPLLGYGGYLPFALELVAIYYLLSGWRGQKQPEYLKLTMPE